MAVGEVCSAPGQNVQNGGIALKGVRPQAGDGHAAAHGPQHGGEGRLAVIALHPVGTGAVVLAAGHGQTALVQPAGGHAEVGQGREGQVDVGA